MASATADKKAPTPAPREPQVAIAPAANEKVTTKVLAQINSLTDKGRLLLPADYSVENALNSAWLYLQNVENRAKQKLIVNGQLTNIVTLTSVVNALHDMCIQGMNVSKKQGYFIIYGDQLTFQRSYFGEEALAMRVQPGIEVYSAVVYKGDIFEFEVIRGRTVVTKHKPQLENQKVENIEAVYAGVFEIATREDLGCEIMTMAQVKKSWSMSKTYSPTNPDLPHNKFPDQMGKRTAIRRRTKPIINSSTDILLKEAIRRQDEDSILAEYDEKEDMFANQAIVDVGGPSLEQNNAEQLPVKDADPITGEVIEEAKGEPAAEPEAKAEELPY